MTREELSKVIARQLFTAYANTREPVHCDQMWLYRGERRVAGWAEGPMADQIEKHLATRTTTAEQTICKTECGADGVVSECRSNPSGGTTDYAFGVLVNRIANAIEEYESSGKTITEETALSAYCEALIKVR